LKATAFEPDISMGGNIWVTGIGVVSCIGINVEQTLASFRSGKTGIGNIEILDTVHRSSLKVGEIKLTDAGMMDLLEIPFRNYSAYSRTSLIGIIAARQACRHAAISGDDGIATALVSATTVGGMDKTERELEAKNYSSGFVRTHPCGNSTEVIAEFLGHTGYRTTLSTACSSGANAIIHGAQLIRHGIVERSIVGGVDALSRFTLNGFNSLMILDRDYCRPFDQNRRGLNLGEGAGFLVLASERSARRNKIPPICRLSGYANSNDAYHQTASSPGGEGAFTAMAKAIEMSGIAPGEIGYINAHGTGTENNDASEGAALLRVFGDQIPPFSSTKSFTGHTLGAAAGIEAVFSVMAIEKGLVLPGLNFHQPMEGLGIVPETLMKEGQSIQHVLSNSFGFGGNNSSLVFSKR
jgi:3-oxoacyl-[acyl-carrier-protein] synthase-1